MPPVGPLATWAYPMPSLKVAFERDRDLALSAATSFVARGRIEEAPRPRSANLANSEAYQWKVAKLQYTDRLPDWFLADGARDVADPSKEPVCNEL